MPPIALGGSASQVCFGCQKPIADFEPHIHFGINEWSVSEGLESLEAGLDEVFQVTLCHDCTVASDRGWTPEAHEIQESA